jgi:hypothetical protein
MKPVYLDRPLDAERAQAAAAELRIAAERIAVAGHAPLMYATWIIDARQRIDAALELMGLDTVAALSADLEKVQSELDEVLRANDPKQGRAE